MRLSYRIYLKRKKNCFITCNFPIDLSFTMFDIYSVTMYPVGDASIKRINI